ncbi:MAG: hypothetical protein GX607_21985 [Myxococcales bacterium]|jgi:hypothetical protein|nr:hypothetical protein [Myxococcales bacterium]
MAARRRSKRFAPGTCAALLSAGLALACGRPVAAPEAYQRTLHRFQRCAPDDPVPPTPPSELPPKLAETPPDVARVFFASRLALPMDRQPTPEEAVGILTRLVVLRSELAAGGAYIDCLDDSIEAVHRELLDRSNQNELYLTLGSIGVGAASATAQGILEVSEPDAPAAPILGITGGVAAAVLGAAAFLWPVPTVWLDHEVNVLRSVWTGEDSGGLTPFVWRLLLAPRPSSGEAPRTALKRRWEALLDGETAERRRELELLLFGDGGRYDLHALQLRETMLDHIETEVDLMNHEFQTLAELITRYLEISAAAAQPPPEPTAPTEAPPERPAPTEAPLERPAPTEAPPAPTAP